MTTEDEKTALNRMRRIGLTGRAFLQMTHDFLEQMLQLPEGVRIVRVLEGQSSDIFSVLLEGDDLPVCPVGWRPLVVGAIIRETRHDDGTITRKWEWEWDKEISGALPFREHAALSAPESPTSTADDSDLDEPLGAPACEMGEGCESCQ